jgi:hypothetical protein
MGLEAKYNYIDYAINSGAAPNRQSFRTIVAACGKVTFCVTFPDLPSYDAGISR